MTEIQPPQADEMPDPQTPPEVPPQGPEEEGLPDEDAVQGELSPETPEA